jgi:uncharacterized membrane protein YhiD involved in acid resistance
MQAIGDSLARGLGMLGALAIIRFRTSLRNPINMIFMFSSIATGIAAGVYGISIAIIGTLSFCLIVWLIHHSPLSKSTVSTGTLYFDVKIKNDEDSDLKNCIEEIITENTMLLSLIKYSFKSVKTKKNKNELMTFEYKVRVANKSITKNLVQQLARTKGVFNVKITFNENYLEKI